MIAAVLVLLAGYGPSSSAAPAAAAAGPFLHSPLEQPTTYILAPALASRLHPGEQSALEALGQLGFWSSAVRAWSVEVERVTRETVVRRSIKARSTTVAAAAGADGEGHEAGARREEFVACLAAAVRAVLADWQTLVLETERRILAADPSLVGAPSSGNGRETRGFVALSGLTATFQPWSARLSALNNLVSLLPLPTSSPSSSSPSAPAPTSTSASPPPKRWPGPGLLFNTLDALSARSKGSPELSHLASRLLAPVRQLWLGELVRSLVHGEGSALFAEAMDLTAVAAGGANLQQAHQMQLVLRPESLPSSLGQATTEALVQLAQTVACLRQPSPSSFSSASGGSGRLSRRGPPSGLPEDLRRSLERLLVTGDDDGPTDDAKTDGPGEQRRRTLSSSSTDWAARLGRAVAVVRRQVGEYVWLTVLGSSVVVKALDDLALVHLGRDGLLASSFLRELDGLERAVLLRSGGRKGSPAGIKERDVELALLRAGVGTRTADVGALDDVRVELRPLKPFSSSSPQPQLQVGGRSLSLVSSVPFPLSLLLPTSTLHAYTLISSSLLRLRRTQASLRTLWQTLSAGQRARRVWTGASEGGSTSEERRERARLGREAAAAVREVGWWIDVVESHFMSDIISVQHQALLAKLQPPSPPSPPPSVVPSPSASQSTFSLPTRAPSPSAASLPSSPTVTRIASRAPTLTSGSVNGTSGSTSTVHQRRPLSRTGGPVAALSLSVRPESPLSTAATAATEATGAADPPPAMDFETLLADHTRYLAHVTSGLLLDPASAPLAAELGAILACAEALCGAVGRWGGDAVPALLAEGWGGEAVGDEVERRRAVIREIRGELNVRMLRFFDLLTPSASDERNVSRPLASLSIADAAGRPSRQPTTAASLGRLFLADDAELAARRHLETLALRLDWGGWFTAQRTQPSGGSATGDSSSSSDDDDGRAGTGGDP